MRCRTAKVMIPSAHLPPACVLHYPYAFGGHAAVTFSILIATILAADPCHSGSLNRAECADLADNDSHAARHECGVEAADVLSLC